MKPAEFGWTRKTTYPYPNATPNLCGFYSTRREAQDAMLRGLEYPLIHDRTFGFVREELYRPGSPHRQEALRMLRTGRFWRNGVKTFAVKAELREVDDGN